MSKSRLLLVSLLALSALTACGGSSNNSESKGDDSSGGGSGDKAEIKDKWWKTTGTLEFDDDNKPVFNNVSIKLTSVVAGEDQASFEDIIAEFNATHAGEINVQFTSVNQAEYETTVSKQIANNMNAPDLLMSHQKGHKSFVANKLIQPYDEAMEASGLRINVKGDFVNKLAKYCDLGYKGWTFDVPADAQSTIIVYNKDELKKLGAQLPSNHAEFVDLCQQYKTKTGNYAVVWNTTEVFYPNYVLDTALAQNGFEFYGSDDYVHWSSSDNVAAFKNGLNAVRDLTRTGLASSSMASSTALDQFTSNKALFLFYMPWNTTSLFQTYSTKNGGMSIAAVQDKIGGFSMAGLFAQDENNVNAQAIFGDSHFFALSKTCEDINKKAAALEFLKWFTENGDVGATWAEAGHVTASTIISNSQDYLNNNYVENYISAFYPDLNYFETSGNTEYYNEIFTTGLFELYAKVRSNNDDSKDEAQLKEYESRINELIEFLKEE